MSYKIMQFTKEQDWHDYHRNKIGGSMASAVLSMNPWKTNVQAWREITGLKGGKSPISNQEAVDYGVKAEPLLRQLFQLDNINKYKVYDPLSGYTVLYNDEYPYMIGTLDGTLEAIADIDFELDNGTKIHIEKGEKGVLEIKTANLLSVSSKEKWKEQIPNNYYIQVLHYLIVTGYKFAILHAQLKYQDGDDSWTTRKSYFIDRASNEESIKVLMEREKEFYEKYIKTGIEPPLVMVAMDTVE